MHDIVKLLGKDRKTSLRQPDYKQTHDVQRRKDKKPCKLDETEVISVWPSKKKEVLVQHSIPEEIYVKN